MKKQILILAFTLIGKLLLAQKPEPVYSFARVLKPMGWYKDQSDLWYKEIKKDKKNAYAWYNYYRANRCLMRADTNNTKTWPEKMEVEKKIVDEMEKSIPGTFEYNLCRWAVSGNNYNYLTYLKKAEQLGENRMEHIADMLTWGEIERDLPKRNKYAKKWMESAEASPGLLYYNYNVINGLKPNAILLTTGDNDTYPVWLLQSQGVRKDVTVLNLSLLSMDEYRDKIFKELNIPHLDMNYKDLTLDTKGLATDSDYKCNVLNPFHKQIVKHISLNKNKYPVYIALTVGDEYSQDIADKLYLTGLAYEYNNEEIDNMAELRKNFEQMYALDHIDKHYYHDVSYEISALLNCNYEVPMMKLYEHYKLAGDQAKMSWIKAKLLAVVKGRSEEREMIDFLNKN